MCRAVSTRAAVRVALPCGSSCVSCVTRARCVHPLGCRRSTGRLNSCGHKWRHCDSAMHSWSSAMHT
jgi:hypothetical protein